MKKRHQLIPASHLVITKDNQILLQRRFNTGYEDGNYSLVSGHLEQGETFIQCAVREGKEEANLILNSRDLEIAHMMHRKSVFIRGKERDVQERIDAFFIVSKWSGNLNNNEIDKCDDLSWFSFEEIPDNVVPYIKHALSKIRDKIFYSEFEG